MASRYEQEPEITVEELEAWRKQYWNLWMMEDLPDETEILFRELSRGEYREMARTYAQKEFQEDWICRKCILWPRQYDPDETLAGVPEVIAKAILDASGFKNGGEQLKTYMEAFREEMALFDNQVSCFIHEAFPTLSIEEIESWNMEKTLWYFSRAEFILNVLQSRGLVFNSPQETKAKTAPHQKQNPDFVDGFELDGTDSSMSDFPELMQMDAFMKGKWKPAGKE